MNEKREKFIILKKTKYGEADLILQALSEEGSKVSFIARSALKSKKRFGGGILEPLHYVSFTYRDTGNGSQLKVLSEASLIDDFKNIKSSYDKLEVALTFINCVTKVSLEGDQGSDFLFNLTGHTLRAITKAEATGPSLGVLKLHFYLKFLFQQGVIAIEPWMTEFLKNNISESSILAQNQKILELTNNYLDSIELLVHQYVLTADAEVRL